MNNEEIAYKHIWLNPEFMVWRAEKIDDSDIKYYRADRYIACLDAAVSLHHWLFEITDTLLNQPDASEREMADMIDDAQLAIDKYNRFCDGKTEEEL